MTLPLRNYHSYEHYVSDLPRAEKFYTKVLGFKRIGKSRSESDERDGMQRLVLAGGRDLHVILTAPRQDWSVAARYLRLHPEGIGFLNFRVSDLRKTVDFLTPRRANFLYAPQEHQDSQGTLRQVAIATPLSDVNMRFIEDSQYKSFGICFEMDAPAGSYESPLGIVGIDHAACSVRTLQPLCAFYRHVLGFQKFWDVQFHTSDVNPDLPVGSGLLSEAYRHPSSGITFANNEPVAPHFRNSQIDIYCHDNRGAGIQHMAFLTRDILRARENAQRSGGQFLHAPPSYYDRVESRLEAYGFKGTLGDEIQSLAEQEILVDGSDKGYLYQVITHSLARHASDDQAGPLFFELIQRAGDDGFGAGNFRALFDEIEQDQIAMQKVAKMLPLELV